MLTIVLTGPESSGKSTLAVSLAEALHCPMVPEFARYYLGGLQQDYSLCDVRAIRRGQASWEQWYKQPSNKYLVCDTDHSVIDVWERVKYGRAWAPDEVQMQARGRLYFLCAPDFPWQPDPLREHPTARLQLLQYYFNWLSDARADGHFLDGPPESRLQKALGIVRQLP